MSIAMIRAAEPQVTRAAEPRVTRAGDLRVTWAAESQVTRVAHPAESAGVGIGAGYEVLPRPSGPDGPGDADGAGTRRVVHRSRARGGPRRCDASAAPTLHGSRLTRRGRVVVALAWLVLVGLVVWPMLQGGQTDLGSETVPVRVQVGDTLWQLAQEVDPSGDPRRIVDAIMELNGLRSGGDIRPGDTLQVPVVD